MYVRGVSARGGILSFAEAKSRSTPVLLIHGNSSCKEVFRHQTRFLADAGFGVVAPDLPGHGASHDALNPSSDYSFPGYAEALTTLMRRLGHRRYHVVGWSLGGHIGLEMWASNPAVVSLTITGTPPVRLAPEDIAKGFRWSGVTALAGRRRFSPEDSIRYLRAMMGVALGRNQSLLQMVKRTDGRARQWMVKNGMAGLGVDQRQVVAEVDRPLAIIQGEADPFVRTDYLRSLRYRRLWKGEPIFLAAGHAPHWERPSSFNAELLGFLNSTT